MYAACAGLFALEAFAFYNQLQAARPGLSAGQFMSHDKARVFVKNRRDWISAVELTTDVLTRVLKPGEQFLALPYDPLYYYLTGRKAPTRLFNFFEHINIPPEQERKIIRDLQAGSINYILLSSRAWSSETGMGRLGQTHCPLLAEYIEKNFVLAARIGDWQNQPGWAWNHGTMILKRKSEGQTSEVRSRSRLTSNLLTSDF